MERGCTIKHHDRKDKESYDSKYVIPYGVQASEVVLSTRLKNPMISAILRFIPVLDQRLSIAIQVWQGGIRRSDVHCKAKNL